MVAKWEYILPDWCRELAIRELPNNDSVAMFTAEPQYRRATLSVAQIVLAESNIEKVIVHEFCHAYTTPCGIPGKEYIKAHKEEGPDLETAWNRINDAVEGCTCDLQDLIMRLVK